LAAGYYRGDSDRASRGGDALTFAGALAPEHTELDLHVKCVSKTRFLDRTARTDGTCLSKVTVDLREENLNRHVLTPGPTPPVVSGVRDPDSSGARVDLGSAQMPLVCMNRASGPEL